MPFQNTVNDNTAAIDTAIDTAQNVVRFESRLPVELSRIEQSAVAEAPSQRALMAEAIETLSATFREMIAPQSAQFYVVAVEGGKVGYRNAHNGDAAAPYAVAGDIIVEVGHDMDLEAIVGTTTLADLVCSRIVANVLYDREADARHSSEAGRLTYTTSAMYLLLSNRHIWRELATPNDVDHVFNYDAILDYNFYSTFTDSGLTKELQVVLDYEHRMAPALLALEAICAECFDAVECPVGWYPLPHTTHAIGLSVGDLVNLGLEDTGQEIAPAPIAAIA